MKFPKFVYLRLFIASVSLLLYWRHADSKHASTRYTTWTILSFPNNWLDLFRGVCSLFVRSRLLIAIKIESCQSFLINYGSRSSQEALNWAIFANFCTLCTIFAIQFQRHQKIFTYQFLRIISLRFHETITWAHFFCNWSPNRRWSICWCCSRTLTALRIAKRICAIWTCWLFMGNLSQSDVGVILLPLIDILSQFRLILVVLSCMFICKLLLPRVLLVLLDSIAALCDRQGLSFGRICSFLLPILALSRWRRRTCTLGVIPPFRISILIVESYSCCVSF